MVAFERETLVLVMTGITLGRETVVLEVTGVAVGDIGSGHLEH